MLNDSPKTSQRSRGWIVKGVLRRGDILMIYGPSGVGKSIYMLNIAAALVEGRPVLGLWKCKQCNVGLADYEMPDHEIKHRCMTLIGGNKKFFVASFVGSKINDPSHINELEFNIRENRLSVLVIDPLSAAYEAKYENQPQIGRDMNTIRSLARRNNCAIILIHHTGKPKYDNIGLEKPLLPRGHHSIMDSADVIFRVLEGGSSNVTSFRCIKTKYASSDGTYDDWGHYFIYDPDSLRLSLGRNYDEDGEAFIKRLTLAKRTLRLSNRKVAVKFGVSDKQVGRWLNKVNYPDEEKLPVYLEVLRQLELDAEAKRWDNQRNRLKNGK